MIQSDVMDIIKKYPNEAMLGEMFRRAMLHIEEAVIDNSEELKPFIKILEKAGAYEA